MNVKTMCVWPWLLPDQSHAITLVNAISQCKWNTIQLDWHFFRNFVILTEKNKNKMCLKFASNKLLINSRLFKPYLKTLELSVEVWIKAVKTDPKQNDLHWPGTLTPVFPFPSTRCTVHSTVDVMIPAGLYIFLIHNKKITVLRCQIQVFFHSKWAHCVMSVRH